MSINLGSVGSAFVDIQVDLSNLQAALSGAVSQSAVAANKISTDFSTSLSHIDTSQFAEAQGSLFTGVAQKAGAAAQQIGFDFQQAGSIVVSSADSMGTAVEGVAGYTENLRGSFAAFGAALTPALDRLNELRPALSSIGTQMQGLGTMLSVGLTLPIVGLGTAAVKAYGDIDSLKRGLTAVAGSAGEAEKQFADMVEVAKLPGLGLAEATKGSISLQAFGFSAGQAKEALLAFGNAIATVGGGKAELDGVIRQLGQMAGAGKVLTQDLRPIIQQVPQVATVLKQAFGDDILSEPAKRLAALGVSTKDFIQTMITELGKLPPVTGGIKNDIENFGDSMTIELSRVGEAIAPIVHAFVENFVPAVHAVVDAFVALPAPLQVGVIAIAGVVAAVGPALIVFGSMSKGLADIIGIAKTFNDMRIASEAIRDVEVASTTANVAIRAVAEAEVLAGDGAKAAAVGFGIMSDAELVAAKNSIALDGALGKSALLATLGSLSEAVVILAGALGTGLLGSYLVSLLDPLKHVHVEMDGAATASHGLTAASGLQGDAFSRLLPGVLAMSDGHIALSKSAKELMTNQEALRRTYQDSVATYNELLGKQREGADVSVALSLAHKNMEKALAALTPELKANTKAQTEATAARKAASTEAAKDDADAQKIFEEAKKRLQNIEDLQKSGAVVTQSLAQAKKDLDAALLHLIETTNENYAAQIAANAGTEQATVVGQQQREELNKMAVAAAEYVKVSQQLSIATLDHQIALQRVVGVLIDGVTYIHSFSDEQVKAAAAGTLSWKQVQDAVLGMSSKLVMVPQEVSDVGQAFEGLRNGTIADLGEITGSITTYAQEIPKATGRITEHLEAVRLLRGEGVQHIQTLTDEIGKMSKAWVSATEALRGNEAAIPQWVKDNTIAIVNGVRVVSDAAVAAHSSTDGLRSSLDGVSTSMEGVGSHSGSAVDGINRVAAAAGSAADAIAKVRVGVGELNTGFDDQDPNKKGTMFDGSPFGGSSPTGATFSITRPGEMPVAGDLKTQSGTIGQEAVDIWTYTEQDIKLINDLIAAGQAQNIAIMEVQSSTMAAQTILAGLQKKAGSAISETTKAVDDNVKATQNAVPTYEDLNDQLWRLVDAGQSNSNAAYELRQQIASMGDAAQQTSNAFSDTITSATAFSAAIGDLSDTAVLATQKAVATTVQAQAALGIVGDPFAATKALPLPSVPSSTAGLTYQPLSLQGGKLVLVQSPPIVIQQVSPEQAGQQVTDILRRAAFQ